MRIATCLTCFAMLFITLPACAQHAAQNFRKPNQPVVPAPDGTIFCEAEEFHIESKGWESKAWGANYFAATFANTFLSRKAFLGAPADCEQTVATITVDVKEAGRYLALVRYEAAYRFETQFRVKVEQGGAVKLDRLYGARDNLKIWAFGKQLQKEVRWGWGAVENVVWEGHDAYVDLKPGVAKISLIAGKQPGPQAKRNVDLLMLTRDEEQVKHRIAKEKYLPLDGWLTQAGDVWLKAHNAGSEAVTVKNIARGRAGWQEHSPYWVHMRNWKPISFKVEAGQSSDWVEVGSNMDTLNDGQWGFETSGPCKLEIGLREADGTISTLRKLDANGKLPLIGWADTRYVRSIRTPEEGVAELIDELKKVSPHGKRPTQTLIYAFSNIDALRDLYGFTDLIQGSRKVTTYTDLRNKNVAKLKEACEKLSPEARSNLRVVSLGDEIGLPRPSAKAASEGFTAFLKANGVTDNITYSIDAARKTTDPAGYYWSKRYLHYYGIMRMKELTDVLRAYLPNAEIGANFSPHHGGSNHAYLGEVFKWVTCFREQGMTLPWSEDYIWQLPVGSPQMNGINLDLSRAAVRGRPDAEILYYVMPHWPGNTPAMWRRLFHNALGHGMTIVNLFEFQPVWMAYTENHVTHVDMYAMIRKTFYEMGLYEDIVQAGQVRQAQVGLWFSDTADIWQDNKGSFAGAKRALYTAILHQQVALDFIVEPDALDGTLEQYKVLYLTDRHVSGKASKKIAEWVRKGGVLYATAGAGMFDETNAPNETMRSLLGVSQTDLKEPADAQVGYLKEDLPFTKQIASVNGVPVIGVQSVVNVTTAKASAKFADGKPAVTSRAHGKGQAIYCAFLPSLSYYKPAIPMRPVDRGSTDDAMAHLLPTEFDSHAAAMIAQPLKTAGVSPSITASAPLVETSIIDSPAGMVIVVNNWTSQPREGLQLALNFPVKASAITLASGKAVAVQKKGDTTVLTFDLNLSDVLILR